MKDKLTDPNAKKALEELKLELATELGITDAFNNRSKPISNVYMSSRAGSIMTNKILESEEKDLLDE
ncbi:MAG: small, acid-soluble spore protein, alpha/beta type [Tissierellia bacterium]|nr:small, acid-soluble spore protein, alpha/beta type [Tissierellia bacterium]